MLNRLHLLLNRVKISHFFHGHVFQVEHSIIKQVIEMTDLANVLCNVAHSSYYLIMLIINNQLVRLECVSVECLYDTYGSMSFPT